MIELEYNEALDLLNRAVHEKGAGYVYPRAEEEACLYFEPDSGVPSCVVGHVMSYKGLRLDQIPEKNDSDILHLLESRVIECDSDTARLLQVAQDMQDISVPWGRAVRMAVETVHNNYESDEE